MSHPTFILHNTATDRWHPISFRPAPMPGGKEMETAERFRSVGHHTEGFATRGEAETWIKNYEHCAFVDTVEDWDGTGIPAGTRFFPKEMAASFWAYAAERGIP